MNYTCTTRTNYFHVKDEAAFLTLMSKVCVSEDSLDVWTENDKQGRPVYGFGVNSSILGLPIPPDNIPESEFDPAEDDCDWDYDAFADELKELVSDDDAIIIMSSGNEGLRYVTGDVTVITSKEVRYMDMNRLAVMKAKEILGNQNWDTRLDY